MQPAGGFVPELLLSIYQNRETTMFYCEVESVKEYLEHIRKMREFQGLYEIDATQFAEADLDPCNAHWHLQPGAELIQEMWAKANQPKNWMKLARVCHLREKAWNTVLDDISGVRLENAS